MATYTQTRLGAGPDLLAETYGAIFTVGSGETTIVKQIMVCNTDSSATITFSLCLLGSSDTLANEPNDLIFSAVALDPGETRLINLSLVMVASEKIYGKASTASKITITISGIVETA
jgi:hypothetical protein